ncbi:hemerythrin domain-containing protein [Pseudoalteromonas sp. OOF1S-7]|uniref:hemerythrin domain-containing protein n=1 Tax=Pseudoalteromonas sp. OOF1S-7 TaxID=2917757 RepID=UPI001EF4BE44|nr:hemerythrin domain-containing protein [Pseudoalteromonas sp. OOF1S-7]MCG7533448.1 hemerythrin domain-containing protein [Pseudoalteromonas sp. OOF1S-7]
MMNLVQRTVQELAVNVPGAIELFETYQINYKTHKRQPLQDAVLEGELKLFEITERLELLLRTGPDSDYERWRHVSASELITHILENYHEKHRVQFSDAIRLTQKVAAAHDHHPSFPHELEAELTRMQFDLEEHMMKEEMILFPMMEKGLYPSGPISVMEAEHVDHAKSLECLRVLTNEFAPPADACNSWAKLYTDLQTLYFDLKAHIHLENDILFQPHN